jgi:hypothetical protein
LFDLGANVVLENADGQNVCPLWWRHVSMSDERRTAVRNAGVFLTPDMGGAGGGGGGGGMIPVPTNALNVGPGEPGPEDEWRLPMGPIDEVVAEAEAVPVPVHEGLLHRLTHKG